MKWNGLTLVDLSGVTTPSEAQALVAEHLAQAGSRVVAPRYVWRGEDRTQRPIQPGSDTMRVSTAVDSILRHAPYWYLVSETVEERGAGRL